MTNLTYSKLENSSSLTKSNMLKHLQKNISKSKIEKILDFTILEWKQNSTEILDKISKKFNTKVIIRSSAIGEDSFETSQAGNYTSILGVNPKSKIKLKKAINLVIKSYVKKNNINMNNQILVQTQSSNIITSGVIFTRTIDNGAPYYIINFEDGNSTTGVTQGSINKTIKIFKEYSLSKIEKKWKLLLESIKEIESILKIDSLDIEFGITKSLNIITIITLAERGSLIVNNDKVIEVPAIDVDKVIDTTGAGDLFASGFLYGLCQNKNLSTCGYMASVAAAEIISHYGARPLGKLSSLV